MSSERLNKSLILESIPPASREYLTSLTIQPSVDSTNSVLQRLPLAAQHAAAILAEQQTRGRGRRGRKWYSPDGKNLYLSLGWCFEKPLSELGCLSLVVALATARTLTRIGLCQHTVKWPNDILLKGRKLCGCLVEMQGDAGGPCHAVMGVGINIHMPVAETGDEIDQPWTDVYSQLPDCSRNTLAALLLQELLESLELFSQQGFGPFQGYWRQMDGLEGQSIEVYAGKDTHRGVSTGVDANGALLLDTGKEILRLHSGEASLSRRTWSSQATTI